MKTYLYVSAAIFGMFALRHAVATYDNWSAPHADIGSVIGAALIGTCSGALSFAGFRLARRA